MADNGGGTGGARRFGGYLITAIGGLIFATSGLCTVSVIGSTVINTVVSPNAMGMGSVIGVAMLFGGIPMAIGLALVAAGRSLLRSAPPPAPPEQSPPGYSPWTKNDPS